MKIIIAGGIFLLGYFALWQPLQTRVADLKKSVAQKQARLIFLRQQTALTRRQPAGDLMATLERQLARVKLASHLSYIKKTQENHVTLSLHAVSFDRLIRWLQPFVAHYQVRVVRFSVNRSQDPSLVDVRLVVLSEVG